MGAYLQGDVELRFAAAYDSDERQVQQIDSLVATGIDLLIVAPNQVATISPAIDRAFDKGIPVIVFERKTSSQKYTAFISADNYEMGRVMGEYIASQLHGKGRVVEIMGLQGSSPAIERHNGFTDALKNYPDIEIDYYQSNVEGELIDKLQEVGFSYDGIVLNAGAYTHTSIALQDCIRSISAPVIEVHISNVHQREEFRHHSYISCACKGVICGFGLDSYRLAIEAMSVE